MISRKIVAIGGGYIGKLKEDRTYSSYETGPIDKEIIKLTGKISPNFLFLSHSKFTEEEQEEYFKIIYNIFGLKYKCKCKHLKSKDVINKEYVNELIEWSDIIYECGGNTLDMIKLWKETGFDIILKKAWEDGKVMCGISAGANCWFRECSTDSLKIKYGDNEPLIGMDCIGLIDGLFVPHCDEPGRYENAKTLLKTSNEVGLLISNCCALEIIDNKYRLILGNPVEHLIKPYGIKSYWKNNKYIEELIDTSLEFKPLSDLFNKNTK